MNTEAMVYLKYVNNNPVLSFNGKKYGDSLFLSTHGDEISIELDRADALSYFDDMMMLVDKRVSDGLPIFPETYHIEQFIVGGDLFEQVMNTLALVACDNCLGGLEDIDLDP